MKAIEGGFTVCARILIAAVFLLDGIDFACQFADVVQFMAAQGVPYPSLTLLVGIMLLLTGSIFVIAGYRTRVGAGMLFAFLIGATYFFYDIWDPAVVASQNILRLSKDSTLTGAMAMLMVHGAGPWSIDASPLRSQVDGLFTNLLRLRVRVYLAPLGASYRTAATA